MSAATKLFESKRTREHDVLRAAKAWYQDHVARGLGEPQGSESLIRLFSRVRALETLSQVNSF